LGQMFGTIVGTDDGQKKGLSVVLHGLQSVAYLLQVVCYSELDGLTVSRFNPVVEVGVAIL